jgi:hypothetical protein
MIESSGVSRTPNKSVPRPELLNRNPQWAIESPEEVPNLGRPVPKKV